MELNKEQDIDILTKEADSVERINKQSVIALLGTLILSTTLWYSGWEQIPFLVAVVGISLLVTPGLAVDGLIYGAMRRPVGSTFGNMIISGVAWYAGVISLSLTLGYTFSLESISGITLMFSTIAVLITLFTGGMKVTKIVSKADFKYMGALIASLAIISAIALGSGYIFMQKNVLQPTGELSLMSLTEDTSFTKDNPKVLNGINEIEVILADNNPSNELLVEFITETGLRSSFFTSIATSFETTKIKTPEIVGCGVINITNKTTGQAISNLYVKDYPYTKCEEVIITDIFERFDLDLNGAPTDSLKELLNFVENQLNKGNLDNLPQEYKDCIKQEDPSLIMECIDQV